MKIAVAISLTVVTLTCIASAVSAGGQIVDQGKVVEDPALDYRKYHKQIVNDESAEQSRQAQALSSVASSIGADEASFQASLAATARALNAGAADAEASASSASAAAQETEEQGIPARIWFAVGAAVVVVALLAVLILSSSRRRKSRRRRSSSDESSARLVDFARKSDTDKAE